jgi:hypothetical protein
MTLAEIKLIRDTGLFNVPETLRNIADKIEAGNFGEVSNCAVVLDAGSVETFYMGPGEVWPSLHYLLTVGAAKLVHDKLSETA